MMSESEQQLSIGSILSTQPVWKGGGQKRRLQCYWVTKSQLERNKHHWSLIYQHCGKEWQVRHIQYLYGALWDEQHTAGHRPPWKEEVWLRSLSDEGLFRLKHLHPRLYQINTNYNGVLPQLMYLISTFGSYKPVTFFMSEGLESQHWVIGYSL